MSLSAGLAGAATVAVAAPAPSPAPVEPSADPLATPPDAAPCPAAVAVIGDAADVTVAWHGARRRPPPAPQFIVRLLVLAYLPARTLSSTMGGRAALPIAWWPSSCTLRASTRPSRPLSTAMPRTSWAFSRMSTTAAIPCRRALLRSLRPRPGGYPLPCGLAAARPAVPAAHAAVPSGEGYRRGGSSGGPRLSAGGRPASHGVPPPRPPPRRDA